MGRDEMIYCGLEGSCCDKNYKYHDYAPCCIECTESCSACTLISDSCEYKRTKQEIKQVILDEYYEDKKCLQQQLEKIEQKIMSLTLE